MTEPDIWGLRACRGFRRDWYWWLALQAGPLFWLLWAQWYPPLQGSRDLVALFSLALLQPALEEVVFRGAVQGHLLQSRWGQQRLGFISLANLATAMLFSVLHLLGHAPLWALAVFLPSLVFGYFRERSGCIYAPFMLHAVYNLGYFLLWPA